jgi:hypothetical protein
MRRGRKAGPCIWAPYGTLSRPRHREGPRSWTLARDPGVPRPGQHAVLGVHLGALQQAGLAERARRRRLQRQRALRAHAQRARAVRLGRQVVHEHHMVVALQQPVAAPLRVPGFRVRG